jgi:hypothetical protein
MEVSGRVFPETKGHVTTTTIDVIEVMTEPVGIVAIAAHPFGQIEIIVARRKTATVVKFVGKVERTEAGNARLDVQPATMVDLRDVRTATRGRRIFSRP